MADQITGPFWSNYRGQTSFPLLRCLLCGMPLDPSVSYTLAGRYIHPDCVHKISTIPVSKNEESK